DLGRALPGARGGGKARPRRPASHSGRGIASPPSRGPRGLGSGRFRSRRARRPQPRREGGGGRAGAEAGRRHDPEARRGEPFSRRPGGGGGELRRLGGCAPLRALHPLGRGRSRSGGTRRIPGGEPRSRLPPLRGGGARDRADRVGEGGGARPVPPPLSYPSELLSEIVAHLVACYPEEGCGLVARRGPEWRFLPISNAATRFHLADPESFPDDARTAYLFDPVEQRRAWEWADEAGWEIAAIVHSHCDADASFS